MRSVFIYLSLFWLISFSVSAHETLTENASEPNFQLTEEDKLVLKNGELSTTRYVIGGIIGTYPGLGIGHAIQGRWETQGWKFTAGEVVSLGLIVTGAAGCINETLTSNDHDCDDSGGLLAAGVFGLIGFRVWEIIDIWYGGNKQMDDYQKLKNKIDNNSKKEVSYYVLPVFSQSRAGISIGITF